MRKLLLGGMLVILALCAYIPLKKIPPSKYPLTDAETQQKINKLLVEMTIEEKAGQLSLFVAGVITGPSASATSSEQYYALVRQGQAGGFFNGFGAKFTRDLQRVAVEESRMKIPLLFGADVIHGFRTAFPLPLAESASWDLTAIELGSRVAAQEATAVGINWNYAPMVDISRDARWGRGSEGAGEDTYLGSEIARARVRGFQGNDLGANNTLAACVKHVVAYGAPVGGRDYNTVDMSERALRDTYFPPFKAAVEEGSASFMSAFNDINGVPATANQWMLDQVLRKEWGFQGFVVSDYNSVGELLSHGVAGSREEAGKMALEAGTDMDMEGRIYLEKVPQMVKDGKISMAVLDEAVRRVLRIKFKLGLFDDPYRYSSEDREKTDLFSKKHLEIAHDMAKKSIVLLKNQGQLLPLPKTGKKVAVIGAFANDAAEMNGSWSFFSKPNEPITLLKALRDRLGEKQVSYAQGYNYYDNSTALFAEAVKTAKLADVIVAYVGETSLMNGEAASRTDIGLPGAQLDLLKALAATGKPVVVLLCNGRPLTIEWVDQNIPAIVETWTLGSMAGPAIADVLLGDYNPSGKLPVTFPRNVGQVPIYYNYKQTGRPKNEGWVNKMSERQYDSRYKDSENSPLYPFGFGLSYTQFAYSDFKANTNAIAFSDTLEVSVTVTNTGKFAGEEVVQLYVRDLVGSVTRPVKELKGFQKIALGVGESKRVTFKIDASMLAFHKMDMSFGAEAGEFHAFVGGNSRDTQQLAFTLK